MFNLAKLNIFHIWAREIAFLWIFDYIFEPGDLRSEFVKNWKFDFQICQSRKVSLELGRICYNIPELAEKTSQEYGGDSIVSLFFPLKKSLIIIVVTKNK